MSTLTLKPGVRSRFTKQPDFKAQTKPNKPAKFAGKDKASLANERPLQQPRKPLTAARNHLKQSPAWQQQKPLVIGYREQALAGAPDGLEADIKKAIGIRCRSWGYLRSLIAGGHRYGWHGAPAGEITAEEQELARKRLEGMKKAREKRREAQSC